MCSATPNYNVAHVQELALPGEIKQGIDELAEDGPSYLMSMTIEGCAITELPRQVLNTCSQLLGSALSI